MKDKLKNLIKYGINLYYFWYTLLIMLIIIF